MATSVGGVQKTFGEKDGRLVAPETQAAALPQYLEGIGQRATEGRLGEREHPARRE